MKRTTTLIMAAVIAVGTGVARAEPNAEEIKQLGTTLTPWGAEKAGNKDGTIPAYAGGLTKPPANYNKSNPGWRPDPFPEDKPLFSIDAKNMDKYGDKLSEGVKAMMRKYPTFRIDVYPTRRSAAYPQHVLDNTLKNATRCKLEADGLGINHDCQGGFPFPIPKNGYEVMWNKIAQYRGPAQLNEEWPTYVKPDGEVVNTAKNNHYIEWSLYNERNPGWSYATRTEYWAPARLNGMNSLYYDLKENSERRSWTYVPAARRVRLAPDTAADTPIAPIGGAAVYDDANMFSGKMDRFDFKLVGKKEMYIPYNSYKLHYPEKGSACDGNSKFLAGHVKPECVRFELHRVWHVHATLKPGKRHIYEKRDFFIDEDAWYGGIAESYDHAGKIYRVLFHGIAPQYDILAPVSEQGLIHDLSSGVYTYIQMGPHGSVPIKPLSPENMSPESLTKSILKY